ncbi:mspA family protein [Mycolicibacterium hassiacum DSM 44199]|uniref:MspA family protein n=1 Tax=Mycolicibacterium hassiacum (strain DSM 44199 / CIP 105218 / JCM 12690 / 3849) TaxID=1122247 RepID=K5BA75_MYCHD|nr:MspA family porin [Mycolicibacterium hassiacum]EKF21750.1 mspA family protein [Mycolicibacterium hassiacum DSM 44199]MBX5489175.1 MspA family porin [Mycolicibacterium hassiacum]MDA4088472.1 membrane protein [Mycolicibacterium hassiacum DSM 44199]VCT92569.1 hypothetical protein MHAS_04299 [Mycolicibacterium hassiacum DSM 44199]
MGFGKVVGASAAGLLVLGASLGLAAGDAHAEQIPVPDVTRVVDTVDGWRMTLTLTGASIDPVPDMAAAPLSRQGFVSGRVTLTIDGDGTAPVNGGQLVVGAQLGCQLNLADGLDLDAGADTDLLDDIPLIGIDGEIGTTIRSGRLTTVGFGAKTLKGRTATINVVDAHVQVDECGGAVSARLFAVGQMSTDTSDDSISLYSAVVHL